MKFISWIVLFLLAVVCGCSSPAEVPTPYIVEIEIWGNEPDDLYLLEMDFYEEWGIVGWICGFDDYYASLPYTYTTTVYDAHECWIRILGSSTPFDEIEYTVTINGEEPENMWAAGSGSWPTESIGIIIQW